MGLWPLDMVSCYIINIINIFLYLGVFRLLLKYAIWKNWQIILSKLSLGVTMIMYIELASHIIQGE